ncbi:M15 family metallopeptidase [Laspinema olomoucense]|uniref:M15 family metallopeptidase n=1 Tax=Laspinema olomoucense TaxID=3231600 RepID=UPI0021BB1EF2|nr:M15 family metallopeptidase [Laspinema sp. D3a]MCT7989306.1 M15 family metallopeptidase [Laspinema sp. D3a]
MKWKNKKLHSPFQFLGLVALAALVVVLVGVGLLQIGRYHQPDGYAEITKHEVPIIHPNDSPNNLQLSSEETQDSSSNEVHALRALSIRNPEGEDAYLGHLFYPEANPDRLMMIASYGEDIYQRFEYLDFEAAQALMKLIYSARNDGVWIVSVSAFRDVERQRILFENQIERRGSIEAASKISAPPGYSEHHTGLAVDLADGRFPKQDITSQFENTEAFQWLQKNAQKFGFEMSFPLENQQGVMYEPWHWRFVGSEQARATFAKAKI